MSPNQREVLSAISTITGKQEYLNSTNGALDVSGGGGGGSATVVGIGPVGQNQVAYDYIGYTATSGTVDTYTYKTGGSGGTTTATVTITYTASDHLTLVSVART